MENLVDEQEREGLGFMDYAVAFLLVHVDFEVFSSDKQSKFLGAAVVLHD